MYCWKWDHIWIVYKSTLIINTCLIKRMVIIWFMYCCSHQMLLNFIKQKNSRDKVIKLNIYFFLIISTYKKYINESTWKWNKNGASKSMPAKKLSIKFRTFYCSLEKVGQEKKTNIQNAVHEQTLNSDTFKLKSKAECGVQKSNRWEKEKNTAYIQLNNKITIYCSTHFHSHAVHGLGSVRLSNTLSPKSQLDCSSNVHLYFSHVQMKVIWRNWSLLPCMGNNWIQDKH